MLNIKDNYAVRQFVGSFFEKWSTHLFQARQIRGSNFAKGEIHPDLECEPLDAWLEIKATQKSRYFKVYVEQVAKYQELLKKPFPFSRIFYVFFSHEVLNISRDYTDELELARDLVLKTTRIIILDFSVIGAIAKKLPVLENYAEAGYPAFLRWEHRISIELEENPQKLFLRLGLKPRKFKVKKEVKLVRHPDLGLEVELPIVLVTLA